MHGSRTQIFVDAIFDKLRAEGILAVGTEQVIRSRFVRDRGPGQSAAETCGKILAFLAAPENQGRYYRPGNKFAKDGESTLQAIMRRMPVTALAATTIADTLHIDLAHKAVEDQVVGVVRHLEDRDSRGQLDPAARPPLPIGEAKVRAALEYFGSEIDPAAVDGAAREWGARLGHLPPSSVLRKVAEYLAQPWHAAKVSRHGEPIKADPLCPAFNGGMAKQYDDAFAKDHGLGPVRDDNARAAADVGLI